MLRGLPASIIAHAAIFGASYVTFPYWGVSSRAYVVEAVDVNFAELGEITNIAPLIEQETEEPEEAAPEEPEEVIPEEPVEEELPEAEQDVSNETPEPVEETPEEVLPDFEQDPPEEPEDTPEPEPEPEPERDIAPKPPKDPLADFLNQSETTFKSEIETRRERPEPKPVPKEVPQTALKDAPKPAETRNRRGSGERNGNTARLEALIGSRIRNECWAGVDDLPNPERYNVQMKVFLNENGTVADLEVIDPKGRQSSYMGVAVDRATRAVGKCAPFKLPADDYEIWKEIDVYLGLGYASR
ncbi:MAG: hypothetical protein ACE37M_09130 [Henriciella sp.]